MNIIAKVLLFAAVFASTLANSVLAAPPAPRCSAPELSATINKPVPDTVFAPGDRILFDGRIWLPGSVINSGKCGSISFFIAPDSDIAQFDCLGQPAASCDIMPAACPVPSDCGSVPPAESFNIIEDPARNVIKLGDLKIGDSIGSLNSGDYSVEFSQTFVLPKNLALAGPVRFYIRYGGNVAEAAGISRFRWLIAYQKGKIGISDKPSRDIPEVLAINAVQSDYCSSSGAAAILYWKWLDPAGRNQSAYQVQISNRSYFSSLVHDSGKIDSSSLNYATPGGKLSWGKRYYWRVKVWNEAGLSSEWSEGIPFDTPLHPYPKVGFIWTPKNPIVGDPVEFIDESEVYGSSTKVRWLWSLEDGNPSISYDQGIRAYFKEVGIKNITLSVTDSDGYTCSASRLLQTEPNR